MIPFSRESRKFETVDAGSDSENDARSTSSLLKPNLRRVDTPPVIAAPNCAEALVDPVESVELRNHGQPGAAVPTWI
jgi:hypothetical protein